MLPGLKWRNTAVLVHPDVDLILARVPVAIGCGERYQMPTGRQRIHNNALTRPELYRRT